MSSILRVFDRTKSSKNGSFAGWSDDDMVSSFDRGGSGYGAPEPAATLLPPAVFGFGAAVVVPKIATAAVTAVKTTTKTTTTTTTVSKLPAWVSTIKTAAIATDVAAAISTGTTSYSGLVKVFTDLSASLAASKSKLTATQLADLKTIAANLSNGVTTSAYLAGVTSAFVNGSVANTYWTGGASTAVKLGNLAVGATVTQINELIGKWFLGTDLPSSKVVMGSTSFNVSYSTVSKPLFSASGPSASDVNQGYLGDCYLLASLAEVAYKSPNTIKSMFVDNGNGTWGVRYFVKGAATWVTVNASLAGGGTIFNSSSSSLWASLAEKAYAELQSYGVVTGNTVNYGNSWSTIGNGGSPEYALAQVTGASQIVDFWSYRGSWVCSTYNSSLKWTGSTAGLSTASVFAALKTSLDRGDALVLTSLTNAKDSSGKTTLVANHAMSITGYNAATTSLQIRNPWGTHAGQTWATSFEVSLASLLAAGDIISVAGTSTTTASSSGTAAKTTTAKSELDASASYFVQAMATDYGGSTSGVLDTALAASTLQPSTMSLAAALV